MLREIRRGLLAIVAVVLGTQVSAFTNLSDEEWLKLNDQDLKAYAYARIEHKGIDTLSTQGLVYAYGSESGPAKIGSSTELSYGKTNYDVITKPGNSPLGLSDGDRCLVSGLTRGEAEYVEMLTQREYHQEGRYLPPTAGSHTSQEIFDAPDRNERCSRIQKNAEKAVAVRTPAEKTLMKDKPVTLHGRMLMEPFEVRSAARAEPANTNSAPTPKASPSPALVRGFEAVDNVMTLPERTVIAVVVAGLTKFAPRILKILAACLVVFTIPWIAAVLGPVLLVLTIVDYALLGWMVMPFLWSLVTAII